MRLDDKLKYNAGGDFGPDIQIAEYKKHDGSKTHEIGYEVD